MDEHNIAYFRNLWQTNMSDLENLCRTWEQICNENQIPDEVQDEIRTTIGLARLLMNQKLKQFKGLMDDSEFNTGEKEITCSDLQGFWDMVYFEVEKINKRFCGLDKCKVNEWKFVEENSGNLKKKVPVVKNTATASKKNDSSKSRALAAKQRLAEVKRKMLAQREQQKEDNFIEIASTKEGFSPIKNSSSDKTLAKESNKKLKNLDVQEQGIIRNESNEDCLLKNDVSKQKEIKQKSHSMSKNKENFLPNADTSTSKSTSTTPTKSKMKSEGAVSGKTRKKVKDVVKLQCVTRSAKKKAMLAQQNAMQKS